VAGRTVIISDLHLGRAHGAATSAEALRPLWQGAARLVVNGDTAEVHHPGHRRRAAEEVLALYDLTERDGVELTLLSGNHDPFLSDFRHLHLAGGRIFVTHGDVMHPAIAPWSPASARIRAAHERAIAALEPEDRELLEARLTASQHAGFAEWQDAEVLEREAAHSSLLGMLIRPWAIAQVLMYWRAFPRIAAGFVERHAPEARFAVHGHTHRAGIWTVNERVIINTGHFGFPGPAMAVLVDGDERLSAVRIDHKRGEYRLRDEPRAVWELDAANEDAGGAAA
jgi:UDP-2,3-diacylglucosamine pyrophosphatase LpxH